jgi:hypothetical protein
LVDDVSVTSLTFFEHCLGLLVYCGTLSKHFRVKLKLFLVQTVDGLHVFHAFFEDLHFLLEFDFLLSLVVCVLGLLIFEVLGLSLLLFGLLLKEILFDCLVMFEEMVDFLVVLLQKCTALSIKLRLNLGEVVGVICSHLVELVLHSQDEFVNVLVHLLHGDHVVLVLGVESLLEFTFKVVFVFYNFLTLNDLLFNF